jgi:hypothetical protein
MDQLVAIVEKALQMSPYDGQRSARVRGIPPIDVLVAIARSNPVFNHGRHSLPILTSFFGNVPEWYRRASRSQNTLGRLVHSPEANGAPPHGRFILAIDRR